MDERLLRLRRRAVVALLCAVVVAAPAVVADDEYDAKTKATCDPGDSRCTDPADKKYSPLGNLMCDYVESLAGTDTDGDGDPDCSDPDDDGDLLTDEFDDQYIAPGARLDPDFDNDGVPDVLDLLPTDYKGKVSLELEGEYEDVSDNSCDVDRSPADPYIFDVDTFTASIADGPGHFDLKVPSAWKRDKHTDPPGSLELPKNSEFITAGNPLNAFQGPDELSAWNGVNGVTTLGSAAAAPQFQLSILFKDTDQFGADNFIYIAPSANTGVFAFNVGSGKTAIGLGNPSGGHCRAQVTYTMHSNVDGMQVGALIAHQLTGGLVGVQAAADHVPSS